MDHEDSYMPMDDDRPKSPVMDQAVFTRWTQSEQSLASITGSLVDNLGVSYGFVLIHVAKADLSTSLCKIQM